MSAFKTFKEVMSIAEEKPDQMIWCISMDGRVDFLMSAGEIKKTVGSFDWKDVNFGLVDEEKTEKANPDPRECNDQQEACDEADYEYSHGKHAYPDDLYIQKVNIKVQFFTGIELKSLQERINNFMDGLDVVNVEFKQVIAGTKTEVVNNKELTSNSIVYTAMITYRVVEDE